MKRAVLLLSAIVLTLVAWWFGWQFLAEKVSTELDRVEARFEEKGKAIACTNREMFGFPFRIGIHCENFGITDLPNNREINAAAMRTASQIYKPGKLILELESPGSVLHKNIRYNAAWQSLRSSLLASLEGPERFSVHGMELDLTRADDPNSGVMIKDFQVHGRKSQGQDVDYAISAKRVTSTSDRWEDYDVNLQIGLDGVYSQLLQETDLIRVGRRHGLSGTVENLFYNAESGAALELKGPFTTDTQGKITGKFELALTKPGALSLSLRTLLPQYSEQITLFAGAIQFLNIDEAGTFSLNVTVNQGRLLIGPIPVLELPPVY